MSCSELIEVCQRIGARIPVWTQGPGGNVSVKTEGPPQLLWIKASGARLDQVSETTCLAKADLEVLRSGLCKIPSESTESEKTYGELIAQVSMSGPGLGRLSMEAAFHALLPRRWVMHFHSLAALLMVELERTDSERWLAWLTNQRSNLRISLLSPEMPGLKLAKLIAADPSSDIFLLANHGVILHSEDKSALDDWSALEREFCYHFGFKELQTLLAEKKPLALARALFGARSGPLKLYFPDSAVFLDRLKGVLVACEGGFILAPDAWEHDADASEIWLATLALFDANPTLEELPSFICSQVADLPLEKQRRASAFRRNRK